VPQVRIEHGALVCGSKRVVPLMGEVHYWRLFPGRWRRILETCRALGLETIATYVPWHDHELRRGEFDFRGRTEPGRNLIGFLDLLADMGFSCFIRPGPYIYAEWTNAGVPDRVASLPRISEAYRAEARVWMEAVVSAVAPYFATRQSKFPDGGPIVLFQPDNEMDVFTHWFENQCGLDGAMDAAAAAGTPGVYGRVFQQFLREAYADVSALNRAWGTAYASIDEAQPAAAAVDRRDPRDLARSADYWRFQHWLTARAVEWHARTYRELGVDLPMVANYYPGGDVQNWRELSRTSVDMLGIDWYPRNEFTGPPPPPGAAGATGGGGIFGLPPHREHRVFLDSCRFQRSVSTLPFIAELECGVWHGYQDYTGTFSPNHYRLLAFSALLAGIKGFNWYMFAGRDNWYFSPVNERGDPRPELAEVFLGIHRAYRELDPPTLHKHTDAAAFFEALQIGTDDLLADNPVLQALYDAGLDHHIVDATRLAPGGNGNPPRLLFYAASDWLDAAAQRTLVQYMDSGGKLVVFRRYPRADAAFMASNTLGIQPPDRVLSHLGKKLELNLGNRATAVAEGGVWVWERLPEQAIPIRGTQIAGRQQAIENADVWMRNYQGRQWTVGYRQARGRGELIVVGLPVNADLVRGLHTATGTPVHARAEQAGVHAAVFSRPGPDKDLFLILTNMNPGPVQTRVAVAGLPPQGMVRATDLSTGEARNFAADNLVLSLGRASGGAWKLTSV
jgi:hypothetical protein